MRFVIFLLLFFQVNGKCQNSNRVTLRCQLLKDTLFAGETPVFKITITNNDNHSVRIPVVFLAAGDSAYDCNLLEEIVYNDSEHFRGKVSECRTYTIFGKDKYGHNLYGKKYLKPGQSHSQHITAGCYSFSSPGFYRIRFKLNKQVTQLEGETGWVDIVILPE